MPQAKQYSAKMEASKSKWKGVRLPCDQPNWNKLASCIERLQNILPTEMGELEEVLREVQEATEEVNGRQGCHFKSPMASEFFFGGLINFLDHDASQAEREAFFGRILPTISSLALEIEALRPAEPLTYSLQQQGSLNLEIITPISWFP